MATEQIPGDGNGTQTVQEYTSLPYIRCQKQYDVVVIGGGTAGVMAAVAAAESGKKVLIAERAYALGGSATLAQVTPLMTLRVDGVHNSSVSQHLQERLEKQGFTCSAWPGHMKTLFCPTMLRLSLEELCREAGVELLYGAAFCGAQKEQARVSAVFLQTLNGLLRVETPFVIDATGDAQVAFMTGCPYETGDPNNGGKNQDMSLRFAVGGIDIPRLKESLQAIGEWVDVNASIVEISTVWNCNETPLTQLFYKGVADGELLYEDGTYFQAFTAPAFGDGVMYFNCPEAVRQHDATDAWTVTQAVIDCRAAAQRIHSFFKKHLGGFENSYILSFAELPGIRESRRIRGEYYMTVDDYNACRKFEDGIAQSAYPIDVHQANGLVHPRPLEAGEYYEVPYRCLVPLGIDNMLVAGRCISASFEAQSSIRIQLVCRALGEAAGIAASMILDKGCAARELDGFAVREEMIARGGLFIGD